MEIEEMEYAGVAVTVTVIPLSITTSPAAEPGVEAAADPP